jgi:hypothetical protein
MTTTYPWQYALLLYHSVLCYQFSLFYAFQWITDLSVKIIFGNFTVKIIKI